jgi:hypothetical protein
MPIARPLPTLSALFVSLAAQLGAADLAPGLVGEYFADAKEYPAALKQPPTLVRVEKQINFPGVAGEFAKTKLSENFTARWSGVLRVAKAGSYQFTTESDDGSRLSIDGKQVVDNGGVHPMDKKSGTVELTAGDHQLVLEYIQGGGEAGCRLLWTPPGGSEVTVPAAALHHDPASEKIAWDEAAWKKRKGGGGVAGTGKYATMDHGPFYSATIVQPGNVCTNKGVAITLDKERKGLAVFDQELLRFSWAGLDSTFIYPSGRDGLEGQPSVEAANEVFVASASTGWAKPGTTDFTDPREKHLGNLPKDWATYHGLYLNGETVVLQYSVGAAEVLEVAAVEAGAKAAAITRSLTLTSNAQPLTMLVAEHGEGKASIVDGLGLVEEGDAVTAAGVIGAGTLIADGNRLALTIPAKTAVVKLATWHGEKADLPTFKALLGTLAKPVDAHALTKGGKGRWGAALVTAGELGKETGAYAVDTITVPYDNPEKAYMRLTGHDFFKDGRAAVSTIDGDVWVVSGIDSSLAKVSWKRYATGMYQPLGLRIVDDQVYVICRDRLMRLKDIDGDGEADFYESFNADCPVTKHYHEFALDLLTDKEGNFYYNKGSNLGESSDDFQGRVLKVSKDGSTLTKYCSGLREPNGMGGGDGYPILVSDNQGNWTPVCRIDLVKEGGFYGFMGSAHREPKPTTYDVPMIWTPYTLDNSSGGLAYVNNAKWGPFKDKPIGLSYGKSSMFILLPEEVDGVPQAGLAFFPLNFASGVMRARFNPKDDQLYLSGMRGWQTNAAREGAFQRVRYTGKPVYLPTSLHVQADAIVLGFDQPLDAATAGDVGNYALDQWNYLYSSAYGSKDYKVSDPKKEGHDPVEVAAATLSADKKTVTLKIPGLAPVMQLRIKYKITAADQTAMNGEVYQTINKIPAK